MGQLTSPSLPGWTILSIDREYAPGAGAGASGNRVVMIGQSAGLNSAIANAIIIGSQTGSAGITDTNINGTILIGAESAKALQHGVAGTGNTPLTLLGSNSLTALINASSSVILGSNIYPAWQGGALNEGIYQSVMIGDSIGSAAATGVGISIFENVFIGSGVLINNTQPLDQAVIIGGSACEASTVGQYGNSVIIGYFAALTPNGNNSNTTMVGAMTDAAMGSNGNTLVGSQAAATIGATVNSSSTVVGAGSISNGQFSTLLGAVANSSATAAQDYSIVLGALAGRTLAAARTDLFILETNVTAHGQKAMFFGQLDTGNLIVGNSLDGTNRDFAGTTATNMLKLLNGTIGSANPVGGGYFYVSAGVLRWVDSAGTNTQLSMTAAGQLAGNSITAYTNNAAANAGTLTNAPAIGNPTKWIPINDNGTIRNIPAW